MNGKRILLIVGGGIAAYKACELIRLLRKAGATVRCVLTDGGAQFVTPMTLAALSEQPVYASLWDLKDEVEMGHIQLSREADLVMVCPATADLMARMAAGIADDLATTLLLATDKRVLAVPAMNVRMWQHAATRRNVERLRADGVTVMEPDEGEMACGEYGPGRLPEPEAVMAAIARHLAAGGPLEGRHVIVTAGPTHEPIDPVRVIANRSSGKQGFAIAEALAGLGARVTLVAGPVTLATPAGVDRIDVETAREMHAAVNAALPADAAVLVAAVADWAVEAAPSKLKKAKGPPQLAWRENPDILASLADDGRRPRLLVGFAAETDDVVSVAQAKRASKRCDWIVANDVSGDVMGGDANQVHLITGAGVESWEKASKREVARCLAARISEELGEEMNKDLLLLTPLARLGDLGLLLLRWVTGAFLIYQSHDNVFSRERMVEFEKFLTEFGFIMPELMAPLSVWFQFLCGIAFILGLLTRWAGLITAFNFIVAVWMVHWVQTFPEWWPALILVFLGILFATMGAGRYALDAWIARRSGNDRDRAEAAP